MENFEVEILKPRAANILYELESMKLIRMKKTGTTAKNSKSANTVIDQIERGLKDVSLMQSGKIKAKSLRDILDEK